MTQRAGGRFQQFRAGADGRPAPTRLVDIRDGRLLRCRLRFAARGLGAFAFPPPHVEAERLGARRRRGIAAGRCRIQRTR
jgi:hypothetical protein